VAGAFAVLVLGWMAIGAALRVGQARHLEEADEEVLV
jgi:hypothetical protein